MDNSDIIIPPPDLKPIITTTAQYVSKGGPGLQKQIAEKQGSNPKFEFLKPTSPYHAFFRQQIAQHKASENTENTTENSTKSPKTENNTEIGEKDQKDQKEQIEGKPEKSDNSEKAETKKAEKEKDESRPPLLQRLKELVDEATQADEEFVREEKAHNFDVRPPPDVVPLDVEIIKLTAQFVAANGRSFLATVSNREQKNPQFAFLKPTNASLFLFFSDLVQSYQRVLSPPKEVLADLKEESTNAKLIFERLLGAAEFRRRQLRGEEMARKSREDEKREMSLIDWHSFVILETIDFKEGDDEYLPPPSMTIEEINEHLEAEKRLNDNIEKVGAKIRDEEIDEKGESSDEDVQMMDIDDEEQTASKSEAPTPSRPATVNREKIPTLETQSERHARLQTHRAEATSSAKMQRCQVCSQNIPVDEIAEHIRIELLDPKWREQRRVAESKMRDSTLAEPSEMSRNLREFVRVRKRPFASVGESASGGGKPPLWGAALQRASAEVVRQSQLQTEVPSVLRGNFLGAAPSIRRADPPLRRIAALPGRSAESAPGRMLPGFPRPLPPASFGFPGGNFAFPPMRAQAPPQFAPRQQPFASLGAPRAFAPPRAPSVPAAVPARPPARVRSVLQRGFVARGDMTGLAGDSGRMSEAEYLRKHADKVCVTVTVPNEPSRAEWKFNGQTVVVNARLTNSVENLKAALSKKLGGLPAKKMKLKVHGGGFLKDSYSLAFYNVSSKTPLEVGIKARGGRK